MAKFDYQGAKQAGYSDEEIKSFLTNEKASRYETTQPNDSAFTKIAKNFRNFFGNLVNPTGEVELDEAPSINQDLMKKIPNFDAQGALQSGYTPEEINEFLEQNQPQRSYLEQGARVATQLALGAAENELLPYELGVAPLASKEAQNVPYREMLGNELEQLMEQKAMGIWSQADQERYDHIAEQIKDPRKSMEYAQTMDIGIRGLAEKATGLDLHPEGVIEKAANWIGFLKDPKKGYKALTEIGLKPTQVIKAIIPGTKTIRGLAAGTALEMAEQGHFGPLGTIAAAITGDVIGHGPGVLTYIAMNPKKTAAEFTKFITRSNSKNAWSKQLIEDARASGLQFDAGTLTDSPLIKFLQARASQSGLTGKAFENFKKDLSGQVMREYGKVVEELGELRFENSFQASEAIKNALKVEEVALNIPKEEAREARSLQGRISIEERPNYQQELLNRIAPREFENSYQAGETLKTAAEDIKMPIKEDFNRRWTAFNETIAGVEAPQAQLAGDLKRFVAEHEGSLLLGESAAESRVLRAAENLLNRLETEGGLIGVNLSDLIKTKRTLGDVANWEFGGSNFESAYKTLVADIDKAIDRTLESVSPELRQQFEMLNAEYSAFKDIFENKNIRPLFEPKNQNYNAIYNEFATNPDKLRALEDMFYLSPRGQELVNQVKRDFAERTISRPGATDRDVRNLSQVLGPQHAQDVANFIAARAYEAEHPLPRAARQRSLGIQAQVPTSTTAKPIKGRGKEADVAVRKKMYEFLSKKSSDQIMKMMDSIEGIRKLKRALSLTAEGRELFKEISRYKIAELIDKKMTNSMTEQVKLGTFSNLLKSTENKAIVKELLGEEAFKRLELLQKNAGKLAESADKFFNASKSGTTLTDVAVGSTAITGVLTGNPFLALPAIAKIGGMRVIAGLLADPTYLKYLEEAILTNNPKKFQSLLKKMEPSFRKASSDAIKDRDED